MRKLLLALAIFAFLAVPDTSQAVTQAAKQTHIKRLLMDYAQVPTQAIATLSAGIVNVYYYDTAVELLADSPTEGVIGYAIDTNLFYGRVASAWVAMASSGGLLGTNGGTFGNETNNAWKLVENSEDLTITAGTNLWTFDSTTSATVAFTPAAAFTGDVTLGGGAGAVTCGAAGCSLLAVDNVAAGFDIGSTGTTAGLRYDSTDNNEHLVFNSAGSRSVGADITTSITLDGSDCDKSFAVTLAGATTITLPDADAFRGCEVHFVSTAVDGSGGVLLDITPLDSDADGIIGGCYETATDTIVDFSGTADADIGLTAATAQRGDAITLWACGDALWCVKDCRGIWANN